MRAMAATLCALIAIAAGAAQAQESTPFAQQPYRPAGVSEDSLLSLGDMMAIAQMRHIKLWQSGKAGNWPLAAYEAAQLRESLFRAAALYVNIPVPLVKAAEEPLEAVRAASDKRDPKAFDVAFANLTTACNACHQAAGLDFIRIRTPSSAPFSNQDFTPARR